MRGLWRGASFSLKFATVILVAGATIAVVPLMLAAASARDQAERSAADKVGIAANLVDGQRASLETFIAGVARQLAADHDITTAAMYGTLTEDARVIGTDDVLGVLRPDGSVVAVQGATVVSSTPSGGALLQTLVSAVVAKTQTAAAPGGGAWLVAASPLAPTAATAFVARPLTAAFMSAIDHNIATAADPVDMLLINADGTPALPATVGIARLAPGQPLSATLRAAMTTARARIVPVESRQFAVASIPIGAGLRLAVATPFTGGLFAWQSIALLVVVILVAMFFIVVVVQIEMRRPLQRLDGAVAALGTGDFDRPVHAASTDEVGRLGASFEAMRLQVRSTMRTTATRASVAMELSLAQPLETALANVCAELRTSLGAGTAIIVANGSEMSDPFAVVDGAHGISFDAILDQTGPLGEGYRYEGLGAIVLCATAAAPEAELGIREFCVAPLRLGRHVHGVLAVGTMDSAFTMGDVDLVASTAEQIALALERYRFLAVVQRQASVDDLTGLYNHRFLVDSLGQQVALAERMSSSLAILMLDIDHFKALNDTYGHHAGDLALSTFAQTVVSNVRRADVTARYGGEEFVVLMPDTSGREAFLVAEKIRLAVAEADVPLPDRNPVRLTVSIGVAAYPEDAGSAAELFSLADAALYQAKRTGRDRICVAGAMSRDSSPHAKASMIHDADVISSESNVGVGRSRPSE